MAFGLSKAYRDWARFRAEVREEINFLIERHGADAQKAALDALNKPDINPRRRRVMEAASRLLKS